MGATVSDQNQNGNPAAEQKHYLWVTLQGKSYSPEHDIVCRAYGTGCVWEDWASALSQESCRITQWIGAITWFRKTEEDGVEEITCVKKVASKYVQYERLINKGILNPREKETIHSQAVWLDFDMCG